MGCLLGGDNKKYQVFRSSQNFPLSRNQKDLLLLKVRVDRDHYGRGFLLHYNGQSTATR